MSTALSHGVLETFTALQKTSPLVQCLTNTVVQGFTANVLLAAGVSPAMVDVQAEAGDFAAIASGVLINLGTIGLSQQVAIPEAAESAHSAGTPWVLDPVAVGALSVRTRLAHQLLSYRPTVIRGNASEIIALGGGEPARGADSLAQVEEAQTYAVRLAQQFSTTVAVSGAVDFVTDGEHAANCANGHLFQTKVTGSGCALGALIAACTAVQQDSFTAALSAHAIAGISAEIAAEKSAGPGSFAVNFLDELASLTPQTLEERLRICQAELKTSVKN